MKSSVAFGQVSIYIGLPHNGSTPFTVLSVGNWEMKAEFSWHKLHALMEDSQQGDGAGVNTAGQLAEAASQPGVLLITGDESIGSAAGDSACLPGLQNN